MAGEQKSSKNILPATPGQLQEGKVRNTRFFYQARVLFVAFWHSHTRNALIITAFSILALIILIARGQVMINTWTADFWNAISRGSKEEFLYQLLVFFIIAAVLLIFNVTQTFLNQFLKLKLREGLTDDLIDEWLKNKRAFRLTMAGDVGVNPDQRLHEDARHFAEATADLGINLMQATVILIAFVPLLWNASVGFVFNVSTYSFALPGYMVWSVLLYVGLASFLTWFVARNLVGINANRYAREGELRSALINTNRSIDKVTLMGGQKDEKQFLEGRIQNVLAAIWQLAIATTKLTGITAGYGWISNVAPYIIASPLYFGGGINLGQLQAAVQAFNQTNASLRWFVDNYGALADWRATMLRVTTFRQAMVSMDDVDVKTGGRILVENNQKEEISFDGLEVNIATGLMRLSQQKIHVQAGKHLLLYGDEGIERTIFYEAICGLWPWGQGRVGLPQNGVIAYITERPYLAPGSLRASLLYSIHHRRPEDKEIIDVLTALGLQQYTDALDKVADWQKILNDGQQQCLAVARTILSQPKWIIANQIVDGLEEDVRDRVIKALMEKLSGSSIIYLSRKKEFAKIFGNVVNVVFQEAAKSKS